MDRRKRILLMTVAALWPRAASAAERVLILHPNKTPVTFTVIWYVRSFMLQLTETT